MGEGERVRGQRKEAALRPPVCHAGLDLRGMPEIARANAKGSSATSRDRFANDSAAAAAAIVVVAFSAAALL